MACSCEGPAPSKPSQLLSLFFPFFSFIFFSIFLSLYGKLVGGLVLLCFRLFVLWTCPFLFHAYTFLVSRARGRFSLTGARYPLYRRGADPAKFERGCQMLAANVEQLLFCRGVHSDASVRLARRNG